MNFNKDIVYIIIIILDSIFCSFLYIKDFKNGKYKATLTYNSSEGFLTRFLVSFIPLYCLYSISDRLMGIAAIVCGLLMITFVTSVLNYKCYQANKNKRIITNTIIINIFVIGFLLFLYLFLI